MKGWEDPTVLATLVAGAALLTALVFVELRRHEPMVDLRVYTNRLFRSASGVMILGAIAFLGVLFMVALFFQDGLHLSALQSGLNTFPEALGILIGSQFVSRLLYPVVGPRRVMIVGLVVVATAMMCLALVLSLIHI